MSKTKPDSIRVLTFIKGLGIGGAEKLISESAQFWDRSSFEHLVVYMLPWKDQLVPSLESTDVDSICLEWRRPPGLRAIRQLRKLSKSWEPDLIHSHLPLAGVIARLSLPSTPHVYTEHNVVTSYRQPTQTLNRYSYKRNDAVVAVSDAVAQSIAGYPGPTPVVIPNGVAIEASAEQAAMARSELGLDSDDLLIVHVGNIRPHKGHATLIAATQLLAKEIPQVTVVSIGGEKREGDLERVRSLAESRGINGNLRFLGRRGDARSFIAAANVIVNPSDVEGLPVSLLEAMALGRPVVATSVGGVPSVIRNEQTGLLVPPGDPVALASALGRAVGSDEASAWGEAGAELVRRDFGLEAMVRSYERLYRQVVHG